MRIIKGVENIKIRFKDPVVTIGIFDGVHLGHRRILSYLVRRARRIKGTSIVITFDPHPRKILSPNKPTPLLVSLVHRINLIKESGVDALILLRFTDTLSRLSAGDFIKKILAEKIGVKEIIIGENFSFGRDKTGSTGLLKKEGLKYGFKVRRIRMLKGVGMLVSSTRIRSLIINGRLNQASRLLGRPVSILGTVRRGARRGRILGYPTANIDPHHEAIPPSGVYAVSIKFKAMCFSGILNIGRRPTFYKYAEPTIEVHIFDFKKSIYGQDLEIEFVRKIRDERKFLNRASLIKQITLDEKRTRRILNLLPKNLCPD